MKLSTGDTILNADRTDFTDYAKEAEAIATIQKSELWRSLDGMAQFHLTYYREVCEHCVVRDRMG